jgi:hypothetical protein
MVEPLLCCCIATHSNASHNAQNGEVCALGKKGGQSKYRRGKKKAIKREVKS